MTVADRLAVPEWVHAARSRATGEALRRHRWLLLVLLAGLLLRIGAVLAARPALMLYGDSYAYLLNAQRLRPHGSHPIGYPLMLWLLRWTGNVTVVTVVQHALILGAAVAIYALLTRHGLRPWLGAVAVAPMLLDAYQLNIEQFLLAESLFETLLVAAVVVLLWRDRPGAVAGAVSGLLLAFAMLTRGVAFAVLPGLLLVVIARRAGWRAPVALVVAFAVPLLVYASVFASLYHRFELQDGSGRYLYSRVEALADCRHLRLPAGQRPLCDQPKLAVYTTANWDDGAEFYAWDPRSPYYRLAKHDRRNVDPIASAYARNVIRQEPGRYARSVAVYLGKYLLYSRGPHRDTWPIQAWRFAAHYDPHHWRTLQGTASFGQHAPTTAAELAATQHTRWPVRLLAGYQRDGYLPGPLIGLAIVGGLLLPLLRRRWPVDQLTGIAFAFAAGGGLMLVVTAATVPLDYRYLLPVLLLAWPALPVAGQVLTRRGARSDASPAD